VAAFDGIGERWVGSEVGVFERLTTPEVARSH
jgi:hypothetical protein